MGIMNNLIWFSVQEMAVLEGWANRNYHKMPQYPHYDARNVKRTKQRVYLDTLLGKMGEAAWDKFCVEEYFMESKLDLSDMQSGPIDGSDFSYEGGHELEVKASKEGSKWLLIPVKKIEKATLFLNTVVGWRRDEQDLGEPKDWVELLGWIDHDNLKGCPILERGTELGQTGTILKQTNYSIESEHLFSSLDQLVTIIHNGVQQERKSPISDRTESLFFCTGRRHGKERNPRGPIN